MSHLPAMKTFYQGLIDFSSSFQSLFLLGIRLFWGYQLVQSGFGKWTSIASTASFFDKLGIPLPLFNAYFVSSIEMGCGALLMLGFASRLATLPIMAVMSVAYMTAHQKALKTLWEDPQTFISQGPFTFILISFMIFTFGPGKFALDTFLERRWGTQKR